MGGRKEACGQPPGENLGHVNKRDDRHARNANTYSTRERRKRERDNLSAAHVTAASKGIRGMPGRQAPMKDAVHCEKPRSAVCRRDEPRVSEWGNPAGVIPRYPGNRKGTG